MERPRRVLSKLVLALLVMGAIFTAFWFGLVPQRLSPLAPLSLEEPDQWFLDAKLATVRRDASLCEAVLKTPHIDASPVADSPHKDGCGWTNAVRFQSTGGARIGVDKLTCEMAAALTLWVEHELQPLALEFLGKRVTAIGDMGTYDCRNIIGSKVWRNVRSQHASANAIDISGFTLEDGRRISVLKDWKSKGPEAQFLRTAHRRACRYFRVALGPDFNAAHANHFHFDRGLMLTCR